MLPREAMVFRATIVGPPFDPGEYVVEFDTSFTDSDGLKVKP
jgi:hypothetical protein